MDESRRKLLGFIHASEGVGDVLFTGSGTESINLAVLGAATANQRFGKHLISSPIESPAVLNALEHLRKQGFQTDYVSVDQFGRYELDSLAECVREETILICLSLASFELGTLQSLDAVGQLARERAITFFVDATVAAGQTPIDVQSLQLDLMALAPSSFGGPVGIGALYKRSQVGLDPLYFGGEQEQGLRPGEENVPAIVGTGVAAEQRAQRIEPLNAVRRQGQELLWEMLQSRIKGVRLVGAELGVGRMGHHLSVTIEGVEAEGLVLFADMRGLSIATAGGCLSRQLDTFYVLSELGLSKEAAGQTISLGIGEGTTHSDLEEAVAILSSGVERLRSMNPLMS